MKTLRVVLFRHGPASKRDAARWPDDDARPLTPRGEARTRTAAAGVAVLTARARAIWTSPLVRAASTAALLREAYREPRLHAVEALRPRGSWREIIERLQQTQGAGGISRSVFAHRHPDTRSAVHRVVTPVGTAQRSVFGDSHQCEL